MERKVKLVLILVHFVVGVWANPPFDNFRSNNAANNHNQFNLSIIEGNSTIHESGNSSDDFNLPLLRTCWATVPDESLWTLKERPGFLRIKPFAQGITETIRQGKAFSQTIGYNTKGEAVGFFDTKMLSQGINTGLFFNTGETIQIIYLALNSDSSLAIHFANNDVETCYPLLSHENLLLRIRFNGISARMEYSTDGANYYQLGQTIVYGDKSSFMGSIGIFSCGFSNEGSSDVDWFYLKQEVNSSTQFAEIEKEHNSITNL